LREGIGADAVIRIVHNAEYGGYTLPNDVQSQLAMLGHDKPYDLPRHHPDLVRLVTEWLAADPSRAKQSDLALCSIDSDRYYLEEYDGIETVWTPETVPWVHIK
jgi:hypothetical protein